MALMEYAEKLTKAPASVSATDIQTLRLHGFPDEQISDAVQVISYFNYINRIADGLGIDPEPGMAPRPATKGER